MSTLYELGRNLKGMGDFVRGLSETGEDCPQWGVRDVGSQESNAYSKACVVTFPRPFASKPVVVASAVWEPGVQGSPLGDSFAVTITKVTPTGFEAIVYRVDYLLTWTLENPKPPMGWSQKLQLDWIAYPAGGSHV